MKKSRAYKNPFEMKLVTSLGLLSEGDYVLSVQRFKNGQSEFHWYVFKNEDEGNSFVKSKYFKDFFTLNNYLACYSLKSWVTNEEHK